MNKRIFNLSQNLMSLLGQRPLLCQGFCSGCLPGQIFECYRCRRLMPWCMGGNDDYLDWCDDCYGVYVGMEN